MQTERKESAVARKHGGGGGGGKEVLAYFTIIGTTCYSCCFPKSGVPLNTNMDGRV